MNFLSAIGFNNRTAEEPQDAPPHAPHPATCESKDLFCGYCRKLMVVERDPMLLECGHSFCHECIQLFPIFGLHPSDIKEDVDEVETKVVKPISLFARLLGVTAHEPEPPKDQGEEEDPSLDAYILCVTCREKTKLPADGKRDLENNEFLASQASKLLAKMSTCSECEKASSTRYCHACGIYMCDPCSKRIHSGVQTMKHVVVELQVVKADEVNWNSDVTTVTQVHYCPVHLKEEAALHCSTCNSLACVLCAYGAHKQHNMELLADAAGKYKDHLKEEVTVLRSRIDDLVDATTHVDQEFRDLEENCKSAKIFIRKRVDDLINSIRQAEAELLASTDFEVDNKATLLRHQLLHLKQFNSDMKLRSHVVHTILQSRNAYDVVQSAPKQLHVLDSVLNDVPSTQKCVSSLVSVKFDKLCHSLNESSRHLQSERFPRALEDIITVNAVKETIASAVKQKQPELRRELSFEDFTTQVDEQSVRAEPAEPTKKAMRQKKKREVEERASPRLKSKRARVKPIETIELSSDDDVVKENLQPKSKGLLVTTASSYSDSESDLPPVQELVVKNMQSDKFTDWTAFSQHSKR